MEEAVAMAAVSLPDDILLEILFRVKELVPAALFRCTTVCIRWRHLIAEPAFLRRCWPDPDVSSSLVGFFTQQSTWPNNVPTPCFIPMPRSALCPGRRTLRSFVTSAPTGVFANAVPLVSRHGLLLVRLDTNVTRGYTNPIILDLAVCNLLTGVCHMLPTLRLASTFDECKWNGYAIPTGTDCGSNDDTPVLPSTSSFFKVVIVSSYDKYEFGVGGTLHTFSSDEESWRVRTYCFDGLQQPSKYSSSSRAVIRHGTAHWIFGYCQELYLSVLNLNIRTGHMSLKKLPFHVTYYLNYEPCLTLAANGALSLLWMQTRGTKLEIWEQQEEQPNKDGGLEWVCTRTIELKELTKRENGERQLCVLGEKCGTLLISDTNQGVYTTNLETGIAVEVVDWPRNTYLVPRETVPFEVHWPGIFSSRLDTSKQKVEKQVTYPTGWEMRYLRGKANLRSY